MTLFDLFCRYIVYALVLSIVTTYMVEGKADYWSVYRFVLNRDECVRVTYGDDNPFQQASTNQVFSASMCQPEGFNVLKYRAEHPMYLTVESLSKI